MSIKTSYPTFRQKYLLRVVRQKTKKARKSIKTGTKRFFIPFAWTFLVLMSLLSSVLAKPVQNLFEQAFKITWTDVIAAPISFVIVFVLLLFIAAFGWFVSAIIRLLDKPVMRFLESRFLDS